MPDRRRVAAKAIIAAGAYLHPNFYFDQNKKLRQIQSDAPITDLDANFLKVGRGGSTRHWRARSKTQFSRRSTIRRRRKYSR